MRSDLRYAFRVLSRAPGFTFAVVSVLALGIGANSAIFSALDQIVIRPLPYADPDRLVTLWEDFSSFGVAKSRVSPATFLDWRRRSQAFEDVAAYAGPATMDLSGGGPPEEVLGQSVTANLLSLLGVPTLLGRTFRAEEEHEDSLVVVLSHRLWQRRFSGDRNLIGRPILMNGRNYTVAGVMPRGFQFPDRQTEFWVPIGMSPQLLARRNSHFLKVVGRLRHGRDLSQAQADMNAIARQLATEFPNTNQRVGITVVSLKSEVLGESRTMFIILTSAAVCVLLIACANIGNLLLVRASARRREMAMRAALGADPARLLRQVLTENLMLAALGGGFGLLLAAWSISALGKMVPAGLNVDLRLNLRMAVFSAAITIVSALLFGLAPAITLSRARVSSRTVVGDSGKLRDVLVGAEVAIALVLVIGAGLLIETLIHLRAMDPGFRPGGILTADINVAFPKYHGRNQRFYSDVLARVRSIPGVKAAGLTSDLPYTSRGNTMSIKIEGQPVQGALGQDVLFRLVSPAYLETVGAELKEGRFLEDRDGEDAMPVVVINETLARQYWPAESPLGHRIDTGTGNGKQRWMTIVGVVRDIRERGLDLALKGAVYVPFPQTTITFFQPSELAVLTSREPLSLSKELQQAVWSVDSDQPVSNIRSMNAIVEDEFANRTEVLKLLGAFATLALLLAALGIYAVLSYVVSQRTREIGVRMAIGASRWDIVRTILGYSARLTGMGLAAGIAIAIAGTRMLSALLYGVSPLDPSTFLVVLFLLAAVALLASLAPTLRAAVVDPVIALREE
ncbi:MAG: ABC transporter permease [Acidobacteria bacterium]|nr:MAG: ABC transporter permease [Acidobacteriota bacterium]